MWLDTDTEARKHASWPMGNADAEVRLPQTAMASQVGGDHYSKLAIQPVEYILKNNIGFCEGCIIKYVTRWKDKGGVEDLRKARHFLDMLIEAQTAR